ncbi:CDP-glycerol glycerophosphotransferase family protein [Chloroflexota bacterium]
MANQIGSLLKEIGNFYRFFWRTAKVEKAIVFYAEHENYYPYFEGLIKKLINEYNQTLCYITSDSDDPVLQKLEPKIKAFYLDKLLPFFMVFVNCRVLVMTLTDLGQFHLKRSVNPVHYVYVFHSPVSTHMIYRHGAFDHYDSILCSGPHQVREIRRYEELYSLNPKNLIETGYYRLEELHKAYAKYNKEGNKVTVLVAPTWGASSLLEVCGKELLKTLLDKGYKVILRLHPETVKRRQYSIQDDVFLEVSIISMDSLVKADILITDWSGIGLKYAFGTERPVIFIDTPPKINNPKYKELGIEPVESYLRDKIGIVVSPEKLDTVPEVISNLILNGSAYKKDIVELRKKYVYAFGHSAEVGAQYIKGLV